MFRNIYRALVVSRTKSAAIQVASQLSHHQLKDIGHSRSDIVNSAVENVTKPVVFLLTHFSKPREVEC